MEHEDFELLLEKCYTADGVLDLIKVEEALITEGRPLDHTDPDIQAYDRVRPIVLEVLGAIQDTRPIASRQVAVATCHTLFALAGVFSRLVDLEEQYQSDIVAIALDSVRLEERIAKLEQNKLE